MSDILLQAVKQAAAELMNNFDLCTWQIGVVTSVSPLEITIENKLPIPEESLYLTKNVMEWSVDMSVDHNTENAAGGSGDAQYESHKHGYKGRKTYLVHNGLVEGDQVYLLQAAGGQKFIVLDRVFNLDRGCKD